MISQWAYCLSHNRPFTGEFSVGPGPLLQLLSEGKG